MVRFLYHIAALFKPKQNSSKIVRKIKGKLRAIFKKKANIILFLYYSVTSKNNKSGINYSENRDKKVIVSLTTYPDRIDTLWLVIESLLRQTFKPDRIILWLAKEQFNGIESLPKRLLDLTKRGLTIRFCDDLGPHKKYYYTLKEFSQDIIVTVDDDCFYPENMLEVLMNTHKKYPACICCNRGHLIKRNDDGTVAPFKQWVNYMGFTEPTHLMCQIGVSGVLYPPNSLSLEVFDEESIRNRCFFTDDLWLKVMAIRNNTRVVKTPDFNSEFIIIRNTQDKALFKINVGENRNDRELKAILEKYSVEFE